MGAMARAVVATVIASVCNWHTSQMSAYTDNDQPFSLLDAFLYEMQMHIIDKRTRLSRETQFLTWSCWGSRNALVGTACSVAISWLVLWRINNGFPRHLNVTDLPSAMSESLISILAKAKTSAEALIELMNWCTTDLAAYAVPTDVAVARQCDCFVNASANSLL